MSKLTKIGMILVLCVTLLSGQALANDYLAQVDKLDDQRTIANYSKSIELCEKALQAEPDNFEANWKAARSCRWYGELTKRTNVKDWEDVCAEYGKKGMTYAQKAIDLKPKSPEGYYWYGLNVGIYSDGVSIITAIAEGLKDKTQGSFEKVYGIDKQFEKAGSILALGRFWAVLPWPMHDKEKSMQYYREYQKTQFFGNPHAEGPLYLAELLIDMGGDKNKKEAKKLLTDLQTDRTYFQDYAKRLMKDID
jgi:tetratricopeptide (TPR) repeat protein